MTYQEPGREPERWETERTQYIPPAQPAPPAQAYQTSAAPGQPPLNPFGAESNETFGIAGTVLALLGGVLGIVALTALTWYSGKSGATSGSLSFSDVHHLEQNGATNGFATAYFSWFAWTALIITVLAAVGSSFPSPAVRALRIIGVVVGVASAGLSFLAVQANDNVAYSQFIKDARVGFYLLVLGYILAAIGAGYGPSKVAGTTTVYRR